LGINGKLLIVSPEKKISFFIALFFVFIPDKQGFHHQTSLYQTAKSPKLNIP